MFNVAAGALTSLANAGKQTPGYDISVGDGDLGQLGKQYEFLCRMGFDVGQRDVYPAVKTEEDAQRAYQLFWDHQVDGWWNMKTQLVKRGICTNEQFVTALNDYCERRKR